LILVDTNAWIHHLRTKDPQLVQFLLDERVHTCDVVIGELMLGEGLPKTFASDLLALPRLPSPHAAETRVFVEQHRRVFSGSGVGWADAQIILAASNAGASVYSSDRAVRKVCKAIRVGLVSQLST